MKASEYQAAAAPPETQLLLLSGSVHENVLHSADTECLPKPFQNAELLDLVRRSLTRA